MRKKLRVLIATTICMFAAMNVFAEEFSWDFSTNSYSTATENEVVWESDYATLKAEKAGAGTAANNYLGGDANKRTSSRFYKNSNVTITPAEGIVITSVVFECTSPNYATALQNSTWTNAGASADDKKVTVTPTDGALPFSAVISATTGSTKVTVTYSEKTGIKAPVISPATGTYSDAQTVSITADEGLTIHYSLDGTTFQLYSTPFVVSETSTVYAYTTDVAGASSPVVSSTITIASFIYNVNFKNDTGGFSTQDIKIGEGMSYVWTNNSYGWVASAYVGGSAHETDSWIVSPPFTLDAGTEAALSFFHALNKGKKDGMAVCVSEDKESWTELTVPNWPAGDSWDFISSGKIDLSAYAGKTIYIGFHYQSTTQNAPTWEIQDFTLEGHGTVDVVIPVYETIAAAKAAVAVEQVKSTLKLTGVTVAYVNGSSTFITDGTDGFLLYGSSIGLKAGEYLNLTVTGSLYSYKGLPELSVSSVDQKDLISEDNTVTPTVVEIADLLTDALKYSNLLVKIEGTGVEAEAWDENRKVTLIQDGEECVMRDNWSVATEVTFKTDKDYNITGFVSIYDNVPQIYPRTADDIEMITNLLKPESAWKDGENAVTSVTFNSLDDEVTVKFSTTSDAAVSFRSTDENVAKVDENGNITVVGAGTCDITAYTEENETYLESTSKLNVVVAVMTGEGTQEKPYTLTDLALLYAAGTATDDKWVSEPVWVKGYIVGCLNGSFAKAALSADDNDNLVDTNVILADQQSVETAEGTVPVALTDDFRTQYGVKTNHDNFGKEALIKGKIQKYFSVAGIKDVTEVVLVGDAPGPIYGDVNGDGMVNISDVVAVINVIAGTKMEYEATADVNGDQKINISDVVKIINVIAGVKDNQ